MNNSRGVLTEVDNKMGETFTELTALFTVRPSCSRACGLRVLGARDASSPSVLVLFFLREDFERRTPSN